MSDYMRSDLPRKTHNDGTKFKCLSKIVHSQPSLRNPGLKREGNDQKYREYVRRHLSFKN